MIEKIKKLFFIITGGRPMIYITSAFFDPIGNLDVKYFKDRKYNKTWMATNSWSRFRVEIATMERKLVPVMQNVQKWDKGNNYDGSE